MGVLQFITKSHFLPVEGALTMGILLYGFAIYQKSFDRSRTETGTSVLYMFSQTERIARAVLASGKLLMSANGILLALSLLRRAL